MCVRLYADSPKDDLVLCEDYYEKDTFKPSIDEYRELNRNEYFYLPGRILHIDGDDDYLDRCMNFYHGLGIQANGISIAESSISNRIISLIKEFNINEVVFEDI